MNARSLASMVFLATMLLVLAVGWTWASAAGTTPGRSAELMAPECQLEQAPMVCEWSAAGTWRCACGPATLAAHTEVLSLLLTRDDDAWPSKQWDGLAAK